MWLSVSTCDFVSAELLFEGSLLEGALRESDSVKVLRVALVLVRENKVAVRDLVGGGVTVIDLDKVTMSDGVTVFFGVGVGGIVLLFVGDTVRLNVSERVGCFVTEPVMVCVSSDELCEKDAVLVKLNEKVLVLEMEGSEMVLVSVNERD